jgi:hypothetical protein
MQSEPGHQVDVMFRRFGPENDTLEDISRVEALVRERFRIEDTEIILVSQDPGTKPGYPPLETNVIFWKIDKRYRLKIFAPVSTVMGADLPIDWLLPSLEDTGEGGCC